MNYSKSLLPLLYLLTALISVSCSHKPNEEEVINYGDNPSAGQFIEVNGAKVYFECYGDKSNAPLLLIHGNGGSIKSMLHQIEYFKDDYYIITVDSRTFGKSSGMDSLNYNIMASDYMGIINKLVLEPVNVLGHSDGGIIGLLLAINYPEHISKLVAAVPNLVPGAPAIEDWELELSKGYRAFIDSMITINDQSRDWKVQKMHMELMRDEPHISLDDLSKIKCPVLLMTSDDDMIKPRHILEIYENIPNAQLFMMPGATHFMIRDEHELYNRMANRFLSSPFTRPTSKGVLMKMLGMDE